MPSPMTTNEKKFQTVNMGKYHAAWCT